MPRNNQRGRNNNNPSGRNQYSSDWMDTVKERPMASAAAAAAAVGAGIFLWSKRNQISNLSDQISGWAGDMRSGDSSRELALTEGPNESAAIESSRATMAGRSSSGSRNGSRSSAANGSTAKARRTSGRATAQSTTM